MTLSRRKAIRQLSRFLLASPLAAEFLSADVAPSSDDEMLEMVNVFAFRDLASRRLDPMAWGYMREGGKDEVSLRENRTAFDRIILRPRFLTDVSKIDLSTDFLGHKFDFPIFACPAGGKGCFWLDGEADAGRGAAAAKAMWITNGGAEEMLDSGQGPEKWWQYTTGGQLRTRNTMTNFVEDLEDRGCTGICFTIDNMLVSHRESSIANKFARTWCGPGVPRDKLGRLVYNPDDPLWEPDEFPGRPFPTATWETVQQLRDLTELPIILKGVLTGEDTALAVKYGMNAVVVSNHGARQLDHTGSTIEALPECVAAAAGKLPVMIDGGFRRGTDILKALALGASMVGIARPYLWGLSCFGARGVTRVIELLKVELALDMGMTGVAKIADINREIVRIRD